MKFLPYFKKITCLAVPICIAQIGHIFVSIADSIMVGQIGVLPLAGATLASTFFHILMLFGIGVSYGITPLVAATSSHNRQGLLKLVQNATFINTTLGILLASLGVLSHYFLDSFGQETEVVDEASPYLILISLSIFPIMMFQTLKQFSEGLSNTITPMTISIIGNIINLVLNYLFIFGKFGFEPMGLVGAGYATLIARTIMALLLILVMRKKLIGFRWLLDIKSIKNLLHIGIPSGLQYIFEVGAFAFSVIMIGWMGADALAAHNIAISIVAFTYMTVTGISSAATVLIGNQMANKNQIKLRETGFASILLAAIFMFVCGAAIFLAKDIIPAFFIEDVHVQQMAATLLVIAVAFQIVDGVQATGLGILRGMKEVKIPTIVTLIAFWVLTIPTGYILGVHLGYGVNGIWFSFCIGLVTASLAHIIRFNKLSKNITFD